MNRIEQSTNKNNHINRPSFSLKKNLLLSLLVLTLIPLTSTHATLPTADVANTVQSTSTSIFSGISSAEDIGNYIWKGVLEPTGKSLLTRFLNVTASKYENYARGGWQPEDKAKFTTNFGDLYVDILKSEATYLKDQAVGADDSGYSRELVEVFSKLDIKRDPSGEIKINADLDEIIAASANFASDAIEQGVDAARVENILVDATSTDVDLGLLMNTLNQFNISQNEAQDPIGELGVNFNLIEEIAPPGIDLSPIIGAYEESVFIVFDEAKANTEISTYARGPINTAAARAGIEGAGINEDDVQFAIRANSISLANSVDQVNDTDVKISLTEQYTDDFSTGGWSAYNALLNPSNTPLGRESIVIAQLQENVNNKNKIAELELSSSGFRGDKKCLKEVGLSDGSTKCIADAIINPGSVISSELNTSVNAGLNKLIASDDWAEIISGAVQRMVSASVAGAGQRAKDGLVKLVNDTTNPGDEVIVSSTSSDATDITPGGQKPDIVVDIQQELNGALSLQTDEFGQTVYGDDGLPVYETTTNELGQEVLLREGGSIRIGQEILTVVNQQIIILSSLPGLYVDLDHAIPGPDTGSLGRFNEVAFNSTLKLQRKAAKKDWAEENLAIIEEAHGVYGNSMRGALTGYFIKNNLSTYLSATNSLSQSSQINQKLARANDSLSRNQNALTQLFDIRDKLEEGTITENEAASRIHNARSSAPNSIALNQAKVDLRLFESEAAQLKELILRVSEERDLTPEIDILDRQKKFMCGYDLIQRDTRYDCTQQGESTEEIELEDLTQEPDDLGDYPTIFSTITVPNVQCTNELGEKVTKAWRSTNNRSKRYKGVYCSDFYTSSESDFISTAF